MAALEAGSGRPGTAGPGPAVLQAVPNFSEGRDPAFLAEVADAYQAFGCEVVHATADPDHNRSVLTVLGPPGPLVEGSAAAAEAACERIDLRRHDGVHPRVGALDVLPFVPVHGATMAGAARAARSAARRLAAAGVPVYLYGNASNPPGRGLAEIRRGGFERLARLQAAQDGVAEAGRTAGSSARAPSGRGVVVPGGPGFADFAGLDAAGGGSRAFAHPSAGAACVGAREALLAWNVDVTGLALDAARETAAEIRESGGGFAGVRALAFRLAQQGRLQISMTIGDLAASPPAAVFRAVEAAARRRGGSVAGTEVIGMFPDALAGRAAARAVAVRDWSRRRVLSHRVARYVASQCETPKKC